MGDARYNQALATANKIVGTARVRLFFKYARRFGKPTDAAALERLVELTLKGREIKAATSYKALGVTCPNDGTPLRVRGPEHPEVPNTAACPRCAEVLTNFEVLCLKCAGGEE